VLALLLCCPLLPVLFVRSCALRWSSDRRQSRPSSSPCGCLTVACPSTRDDPIHRRPPLRIVLFLPPAGLLSLPCPQPNRSACPPSLLAVSLHSHMDMATRRGGVGGGLPVRPAEACTLCMSASLACAGWRLVALCGSAPLVWLSWEPKKGTSAHRAEHGKDKQGTNGTQWILQRAWRLRGRRLLLCAAGSRTRESTSQICKICILVWRPVVGARVVQVRSLSSDLFLCLHLLPCCRVMNGRSTTAVMFRQLCQACSLCILKQLDAVIQLANTLLAQILSVRVSEAFPLLDSAAAAAAAAAAVPPFLPRASESVASTAPPPMLFRPLISAASRGGTVCTLSARHPLQFSAPLSFLSRHVEDSGSYRCPHEENVRQAQRAGGSRFASLSRPQLYGCGSLNNDRTPN
jgi:hypothetical protein